MAWQIKQRWAACVVAGLCASGWGLADAAVLDIGAPTGQFSVATALNNTGLVGGFGQAQDGQPNRALLWTASGWTTLSTATGQDINVGAITDEGVVVGSSGTSDGHVYATVWTSPQQYSYLPGLADYSVAHDINAAGQVVGVSYDGNHDARAVAWSGGNLIQLGTLGGVTGVAMAVNNQGWVVGASQVRPGGVQHAALWASGQVLDLGSATPDADSTAMDINTQGQIVGVVSLPGVYAAVRWDQGQASLLASLGGSFSRANAINDHGWVVGLSTVSGGQGHAALWLGDQVLDLNSFMSPQDLSDGWYLSEAKDINADGWIVGTARNDRLGGVEHAFLLSPVPEPSTALTLSIGFVALAGLRRRAAATRSPLR
jgi:probable HAF family extracellular repeat protein